MEGAIGNLEGQGGCGVELNTYELPRRRNTITLHMLPTPLAPSLMGCYLHGEGY